MSNTKIQNSKRLSILSTEEIDSLYGLPHFTEGERQLHFDLSPEERETIDAARTITAGVHLVLQLGYFKAKAQFFVVSLDYVRPDINHILTRYYPGRLMTEVGALSKPTRLTQQRIILGLLAYRLCGGDERQALIAFAQRTAMLSTQPQFILREVLEQLSNQRTVAPGYTFLQDLVSQAVTDERKRVTRKLEATLPANLQQSLNALLQADDKIHLINVLKHEAKDFSNKELRQEADRRKQLAPLHSFAQTFLTDANLSSESIKYYAGLIQFYTVYKLRRMDASTARLYLLCFAFHRFRQINDNLIEAFIHLVGQFDKQAKLAAKAAMHQASEEANSNLKAAGEVLGLFVDESIASDCPFSTVKERAFGLLEPAAFPSVSNYLRNVAFDKLDYEWNYFTKLSATIKRNLRHLFCDIDFAGRLEDAPLVRAISAMQTLLRQNKSLRQADSTKFPEAVIPLSLKKHLYVESIEDGEKYKTLDVDRYEFLVYRLLRNALESGDMYVNHSNEFRQFEDDLINDARWSHKDAVLAEIGQPILQAPIAETLTALRTKLEDRFVAVNQRVSACVNAYIKVVGQGEKKRWSLIYPAAPETGNGPFYSQLPGIGIADLLRFVNGETNFLDDFKHVLDRGVKHAPDPREILACVVAFGTNMGLGKMAEVSGMSHAALITTARNYLRPETVHAANDAISNATSALSAFKLFNIREELHSSSDGQRFETQINTFNSRYSPKYFGWDKGVSACTVVANHVPINAKIIGTHEHESHFVFDLLYNNTSDIKPTRHSTDTHGTNQVNYWILYGFGYSYAPRYKRLQKKTASLVGFSLPSQYPAEMLIRPANKVNEDLIISEWPNIQRIMASLAQKDTTQTTIVRKLSSYARQNNTKKGSSPVVVFDLVLEHFSAGVLRVPQGDASRCFVSTNSVFGLARYGVLTDAGYPRPERSMARVNPFWHSV
jgi:TnpA family transposase